MSHTKYLVEVRDANGQLDFRKEDAMRKTHPFLFSKQFFTIDELAWWVSYGAGGRGMPSGPSEARAFLANLGFSIRPKTW